MEIPHKTAQWRACYAGAEYRHSILKDVYSYRGERNEAREVGGSIEERFEGIPKARPAAHRPGSLCGEEYPSVKALKGFGGRSVLEIVAPHHGDTYRAVYTVRFQDAIYVLHAFQKKSKKGIATPKKDLDLIRERLAAAERDYSERQK